MVCLRQDSVSPKVHKFSGGDPIEGKPVMQFRLLYSGRLLGASRSDTRASFKHAIRLGLHPQLKRLWATNAGLSRITNLFATEWIQHHSDLAKEELTDEMWHGFGLQHLAKKWERCERGFIPLVTEEMHLRCKLDILFLRPEEPGRLIQGGDLDNRLKTLFDALRMPSNLDECGGNPSAEEPNPIYCLLEDDRLISDVRVVTDSLLLLPKEREINENDVFLVIDVQLEAPIRSMWGFAFD